MEADNLDMRMLTKIDAQVGGLVGGNAELVPGPARRGVVVGPGVDIGVEADGHAGGHAQLRGDGGDAERCSRSTSTSGARTGCS